jgi:hypothetical protein
MSATPSKVSSVQLYKRLHWSMLPVDGDSKEPLCPWRDFTSRHPDTFDIHNWQMRFPKAGIAVITGPISDLLVLDADGPEAITEIERKGLPKTPMVRTPGNPSRGRPEGMHIYFRHPKNLAPFKSSTKLGDSKKLDVRGAGSYVVAPYTRRSDGRAYRWLAHPDHTPLADPPAWFLKMLKAAAGPAESKAHLCAGPVGHSGTAHGGSGSSSNGPMGPAQRGGLLDGLPARLRGLIEADLHKGVRSERDFDAVVGMLAVGLSEETIKEIFELYPVGDKYREGGGERYLKRTLSLAYEAVKVVRIKYADLNEYASRDGDGTVDRRLQLCMIVEEGTGVGELIRCGITVPKDEQFEERWSKFFAALDTVAPFGKKADGIGKCLIGKTLRVHVDSRGHRLNPVVGFYKI